jgi:hypothetical protein
MVALKINPNFAVATRHMSVHDLRFSHLKQYFLIKVKLTCLKLHVTKVYFLLVFLFYLLFVTIWACFFFCRKFHTCMCMCSLHRLLNLKEIANFNEIWYFMLSELRVMAYLQTELDVTAVTLC